MSWSGISNRTTSPSRRAAIGPPRAASGATCPAISPRVAPEKRPSVMSATRVAEAGAHQCRRHGEHLAHAGPAARALVADRQRRRRIGSVPERTAADAASSLSKTRARTRELSDGRTRPALTTAPSGARLPLRITRPPVGLIGFASGRTTCCPDVSTASRASSPMVRPVTVMASPVEHAGVGQALHDEPDATRTMQVGRDEACRRASDPPAAGPSR